MATATAALRMPEDLAIRYDRLAKSTGRTKTFYMTEALAAEIDRLEYEYGLLKKVEDYRAGRLETVTLDELEESLDLASRGRQGHPAFDEDSDDDDDSDDYEEDDSMFADLF